MSDEYLYLMEKNAAKIIRISNHHFKQVHNVSTEEHVLAILTELDFQLREKTADGFIETWSNEKYKDHRIHSLFYFDSHGTITHRELLTAIS